MSGAPVNIAILFSGHGSNLQALSHHIARDDVPARLVMAISNRPAARGIDFCADANIPCEIIDHTGFESRDAFDAKLDETLRAAGIDLICCAGFMRLLTEDFVNNWRDRLINIHPSLLPKYKGLDTHTRALEAGDREHGCTVHYMRPEMDDGPIIVQKTVPVLPDDTPDTLAARVLEQEHIAYPEALDTVLIKMAGT
ncbi:MAG: phosphoribosylglycinamide formyltransferase [Alphaproteobacteria bacterium]|nr:phosphoribosylglycinamide formyltransferase [Alphaproteobacteria bacterium]